MTYKARISMESNRAGRAVWSFNKEPGDNRSAAILYEHAGVR